jgi:hypothetical protein
VKHRVGENALARLVVAYFVVVCATIPFAIWRFAAYTQAKGLFPAIILFVAFLFCRPTRSMLDRLHFGFVLIVLFFAAWTQIVGMSFGGRLMGIGGSFDSNDNAAVLALAAPAAIGLMIRARTGNERIGAALGALACVTGVIATGSRGGTLALLVGCAVFILGLGGTRRIIGLATAVVLGFTFWSTASPGYRARIRSITDLSDDYNYTSEAGRKAIWRRARGYFWERPVLGVGAGNFQFADGAARTDEGLTGKWSTAHNSYIQAFVELGTIGGIAFLCVLGYAGKAGFALWRPRQPRGPPALHRPELLAGLATFATASYFLSHAYFTPYFGLLGLLALADRVRSIELASVGVSQASEMQAAPVVHGERGGLAHVRQRVPGRFVASSGLGPAGTQ